MSIRKLLSSPYLTTKTGLFDTLATVSFFYLAFASIAAIWTSWSFAARIDIGGWLIPHATKVLMWSFVSLVWLRPRFNWRYPFAFFMLYCGAELFTNMIYLCVHITDLTDVWLHHTPIETFLLAQAFFIMGIGLGYIVLRGRFNLALDWSMLPFAFFLGAWVATGYQTESTISFPSYWLETEEFIWNALYLTMVTQGVFRVKQWMS